MILTKSRSDFTIDSMPATVFSTSLPSAEREARSGIWRDGIAMLAIIFTTIISGAIGFKDNTMLLIAASALAWAHWRLSVSVGLPLAEDRSMVARNLRRLSTC